MPQPRALVLSGGGARGAYEVGVLGELLRRAAQQRASVAEIVCGTSVGAITAAFVAASLDDPASAAERMEVVWSGLDIEDVLGFGFAQAFSLPRVVLGGEVAAAIFDGRILADQVAKHVPWDRIPSQLASGRLDALTVTATHVPTGRPHVFVQRRADVPRPDRVGRRVVVRDEAIGLPHVLASAAIPLLFPPVRIGPDLYVDGGLRLNTPLGPAIRSGARRVLAISLSTDRPHPELASARYPGASFLMGKVLDAFLLDHVSADLDELFRINRFLEDGAAACGPGFVEAISVRSEARGEPAFYHVDADVVRPSEDLGVLAAHHLRRMKRKLGRISVARALLRVVDSRETASSDLASYLLFDRGYVRELIDLGRRDAAAAGDALDAFLVR